MPRKRLFRTDSLPYHVTARSHNKDFFELPLDQMWDLLGTYLNFCTPAFGIRIHAFVMMSNHFHMLVSTPNSNLDEFMNYFMRESAKAVNRETGSMNQVYGGPYFRSVIKSYNHYVQVYRYVYRNPIEAGLNLQVERYPYSTLPGVLGQSKLTIPTFDNVGLIQNPMDVLSWLNRKIEPEIYTSIHRGLKKSNFEPARTTIHRHIPTFDLPHFASPRAF